MNRIKGLQCGLLAATMLYSGAAYAQAGVEPAQSGATSNDSGQLGEIIVTAQRRAQTLQDVPVAVAVLDASALAEQHINSIDTLNTAVPNLVVAKSPFQPFVAIRGLGSGGGGRAFEQSVATYVDGIYAGRANQFLNPFFDVERVEIVRGPQSVLFGVNANAGAINIVNKRPGDKLEGYVSSGYDFAYDGYNFEGGVSVPLTPTLGVRLAGRVNREGGYVFNTVTKQDDGQVDSEIGRIIVSWRPTDGVRFDLSYEHAAKRTDSTTFQLTSLGLVTFPPNIEDGHFDFRKSTSGDPEYTRIRSDNVTLNASYDLGAATLSSSSGYSTYTFSQAVGGNNHPVYTGTALGAEKFDQFYQELRLVSAGKNFFDYILGATYYHQRSRIDQGIDLDFVGFGAPGVTAAIRNNLDQRTNGYSAFAQGTFNFTDQLNLVVGGRYSSIRKAADYVIAPTSIGQPLTGYSFDPASLFIMNGPPFGFFQWLNPADPSTIRSTAFSRKRTFNAFNPAVSLNYKFNNGLSAYASFTTGTKAGGYNDQEKSGVIPENGFANDVFEYASEKARNFEVGVKFGTGTIRANFAAFYTKYKDLQATQSLPSGALLTTNAASATAKGLEADVTWRAAPGLTISADAAYIHARYDDYPGGCAIGDTNCADPTTGNARGGRLDGVPDFTGSVSAAYTVPVSDVWELRTRGRVYYNDGAQFQSNQSPLDRVPGYTFLDASIGLAQIDGGLSVTLSGKNLTNKAARGFSAPSVGDVLYGHYSATLPGRQVFLDVRYDF